MKKFTSIIVLFLGFLPIVNAQNIITVDNSTGANAQFSDLQSAVSSASDGDIIYIHASVTNYGNITVDKPLTLIGFSHSAADKKTLITDIVLGENASNSKFSGLHLTDDFLVQNLNTTLTNITIENCIIDSVILFNDAGANNVIIRGNIIGQIGSTVFGTSANNYSNTIITNNIITTRIGVKNHQSVTIKNNLFLQPVTVGVIFNTGNASGSISVENNILYYSIASTPNPNSTGVIFENCLSYNRSSGNVTTLMGSDNLDNQNPLFIEDNDNIIFESTIDNYNLQTNSPAISAGVNGEDLGLFDDSSFTFNNFGFTNGIPTIKIEAISTTVAPDEDLNVIISTTNH
ncbi:hypothetical protein [Maribacter sp. 2304DJ31-5]|uniref:hypothetical protein n=1 Tax=Maribacter sp. 2304DJ31-5 TaxID=3386273 RepID=UPI0039BCBA0E